ncbi:FMN-binding negative transcriptional regulator [Zeaxanthinibacter enoshimensis]|uniref:Transcriptional regulator n=1 Tax=Zeaxanthinibacter enoshimensis TaxID=392009 RepID=A0A4R6TH21_9FLAO|nr:FMN-binding negative transcriptional regulator [Zeaxanthinibacter enoshimensis]TDQ29398.1 transcriptional regulator [Zeaxanthinibacter enoshimensis]
MYIPAHYKNENLDEVRQFLRENAFGILVNQVYDKPWATHLPLELFTDPQGKDWLVGHVAKANPQWKSFSEEKKVLCIFNGPHSYISSSWYKEEEVPTWNYIAVHVYGRIFQLTEEELLHSLERLIDKYEQDSANPVVMSDLSARTMKQIKGIVGFKVAIEDIQAAYKLSQTRKEDHPSITSELENRGTAAHCAMADLIRKHSE